MSTLKIADKNYELIGGGVVCIPTVYGMKEVLNLMFKTSQGLDEVKALFVDSSKTATIQIVDDKDVTVAYTQYIHLDSTITIATDGTQNTYTLKLYKDDAKSMEKELEDANQKIENLSKELNNTQAALNTLLLTK